MEVWWNRARRVDRAYLHVADCAKKLDNPMQRSSACLIDSLVTLSGFL